MCLCIANGSKHDCLHVRSRCENSGKKYFPMCSNDSFINRKKSKQPFSKGNATPTLRSRQKNIAFRSNVVLDNEQMCARVLKPERR